MKVKTVPVSVKAVDEDAGVFEAIVSVFGNKDSYGDVVVPGAFKNTLEEWAAKGDPIPSYWSHRMDDPDYNIGEVIEAKELMPGDPLLPEHLKDRGGLYTKVQIDLEATTSKAPQVHRLLKGRRVTQFSFAYDVVKGGFETVEGEDVYALHELKLYEVGPTPIGANQETELLAVKAATEVASALASGLKEGRVLAAKHIDSLRAAQEAIGAVITAAEAQDDQEKASGESEAKSGASDEEPPGAKSPVPDEEPKTSPSARVLAAHRQLTLKGSKS